MALVREILVCGTPDEARLTEEAQLGAINELLEECARFRNDLDQEVRDEEAGELGRN